MPKYFATARYSPVLSRFWEFIARNWAPVNAAIHGGAFRSTGRGNGLNRDEQANNLGYWALLLRQFPIYSGGTPSSDTPKGCGPGIPISPLWMELLGVFLRIQRKVHIFKGCPHSSNLSPLNGIIGRFPVYSEKNPYFQRVQSFSPLEGIIGRFPVSSEKSPYFQRIQSFSL